MKSEATSESGLSYLLASDFDQTLSFNDSGYAQWDLLGIRGSFLHFWYPSVSVGR